MVGERRQEKIHKGGGLGSYSWKVSQVLTLWLRSRVNKAPDLFGKYRLKNQRDLCFWPKWNDKDWTDSLTRNSNNKTNKQTNIRQNTQNNSFQDTGHWTTKNSDLWETRNEWDESYNSLSSHHWVSSSWLKEEESGRSQWTPWVEVKELSLGRLRMLGVIGLEYQRGEREREKALENSIEYWLVHLCKRTKTTWDPEKGPVKRIRGNNTLRSHKDGSNACFHHPHWNNS